jgi:hypothetical protein
MHVISERLEWRAVNFRKEITDMRREGGLE